jgi:hypothetical protein
VHFTLPSAAPATLEVLDVAGRRLASREVGGLGPGPHDLVLNVASGWRPGLYLVRLRQATRSLTAKAVVVW